MEEPSSTPPKLSLFSLPHRTPDFPGGLTPPPNAVATIPFQWEEAPGKPRTTAAAAADDPAPPPKSKTVRSLHLPPRLFTTSTPTNNNGNVEIIPSPTTVLGGPYHESLSCSPEKVVVGGGNGGKRKIMMPLRKIMGKERSSVRFSSWRWESFRDTSGAGAGVSSFSSSSSLDELSSFHDSNVKISKVSRRRSFIFSNSTTGLLASMYGSLKQAVPWRRR